MAFKNVLEANFYQPYAEPVFTLIDGIFLQFKKSRIKKLYGIRVGGYSNVTGGVRDAAGNILMVSVLIGKGVFNNQLNSPPLASYQAQVDGNVIDQFNVPILSDVNPQIVFNPPLQISENDPFFVWVLSAYESATGTQHDTNLNVTVMGQLLAPQINAQLPMSTYINDQSTNQV